MSLKARIQKDINSYMKAGDNFKRDTLRLVLGGIQSAEKSGKTPKEFSDTDVEKFLAKQVKTRRDSANTYAGFGETERAAKENAEADLIATYIPEQLDEEVVLAIVNKVFATFENPTIKEKGAIMKAVNAEVKGRFDGKTINEMVSSRLA